MPEGRRFHIESHGDAVRLRVGVDFMKHREESVDCVSEESVLCCERTNAVIGAVDYAVAVKHKQLHYNISLRQGERVRVKGEGR